MAIVVRRHRLHHPSLCTIDHGRSISKVIDEIRPSLTLFMPSIQAKNSTPQDCGIELIIRCRAHCSRAAQSLNQKYLW